MKNYILYENGYAKTFYRNIDEDIVENIKKSLTEQQTLEETDKAGIPAENLPPLSDEDILADLRNRREIECFSIINRGKLWYDNLTEEQLVELGIWYKEWLDVTETRAIPEKPSWLEV